MVGYHLAHFSQNDIQTNFPTNYYYSVFTGRSLMMTALNYSAYKWVRCVSTFLLFFHSQGLLCVPFDWSADICFIFPLNMHKDINGPSRVTSDMSHFYARFGSNFPFMIVFTTVIRLVRLEWLLKTMRQFNHIRPCIIEKDAC